MRITGCHIENFGKLSGLDMTFDRNLTVVAHENGWGKSTLMSFIRVMFYGFGGENKRTNNEKERVRLKPWQGGVYGGTIVFESDGKTYILTRTFGSKADEDTFELRDASTNLPCTDYSENIGQELFKIDRDSFTRTVFISQDEIESAATDDINAKMGNLADNTNDINNYETADNKMKTILNSMSLSRSTGSLNKLKKEIADITTELKKADILNESCDRIRDVLKSIAVDKKRITDEQQVLSDKINEISRIKDLKAKAIEYKRLLDAENEAKQAMKASVEAFNNGIPLDEDALKSMSRIIDECGRFSDECADKVRLEEKLASRREAFEYQQRQLKKRKTGTILLIIGLIVFLACAFLLILTYVNKQEFNLYCIIGVGLGFITAIIGAVIRSNSKFNEAVVSEDELDGIRRHIDEYDFRIENFLKANSIPYDRNFANKALRELQNSTIEKMSAAKVNIANYNNAQAAVNKAAENLKMFESNNNTEELKSIDIQKELPDVSAFAERFRTNAELLDQYNSKEGKYRSQLLEYQNELDELELKKALLEKLSEKLEDDMKKYSFIGTAREYLAKAKENMTARYIKPLKESFGKYYQIATGTAAEAFLLDANAQLTYSMYGAQRAISSLSRGYKDIASVCLRLAFIDAMYKNEKPMIVLDDAFVNLDASNTQGAMKLLDVISEEYQVIYFTRE